MAEPDGHLMQCMEVFGGNHAIDTAVSMAGLDAWVFSVPQVGNASGGDVHYLSSCATGRISRFLVADVSGHGEAVSAAALLVRGLMRRFVNTIDQTRLIEGMNRELTEVDEDGTFATAVVATYWAPTDYLVLTNAGHPRPLIFRAATRAWSPITTGARGPGPANMPLGVIEPARYDEVRVTLARGDLVLVYTDSLTEARDASGAQLGEDGLLAMLGRLDTSSPERLIAEVRRAIEESGRRASEKDDLTLLLVRHTGTRPRRMTIGAWWKAFLDFARMARSSWRALPWPEWSLANLGGALFPRLNERWSGKQRRERDQTASVDAD